MVVVWNLKTKVKSPAFCTAINESHSSPIISIKTLKASDQSDILVQKSTEICTLDEDGDIYVWMVISKLNEVNSNTVILVKNIKISLKTLYSDIIDFKCTDFGVSRYDSGHFYISTNYGTIMHCLTNGGKATVRKFDPGMDATEANCLEVCPFSSKYLLVGFNNGEIGFYSNQVKHPLMLLKNNDTTNELNAKINAIQWSFSRPLIFYTKDATNTIHLWNLKVSDMYPTHSIPFKERIVSMKLSSLFYDDMQSSQQENKTFMIVASETQIYVYFLNDEHGQQKNDDFQREKNIFLNYINRFG